MSTYMGTRRYPRSRSRNALRNITRLCALPSCPQPACVGNVSPDSGVALPGTRTRPWRDHVPDRVMLRAAAHYRRVPHHGAPLAGMGTRREVCSRSRNALRKITRLSALPSCPQSVGTPERPGAARCPRSLLIHRVILRAAAGRRFRSTRCRRVWGHDVTPALEVETRCVMLRAAAHYRRVPRLFAMSPPLHVSPDREWYRDSGYTNAPSARSCPRRC